jgi:ketosteroid isomerase-like protein
MSELGDVKVVEAFYHAFNKHDIDAITNCLSDDIVWSYQGKDSWSRDQLTGLLQQLFQAHPDLSWDQCFAFAGEDGWVCSEAKGAGSSTNKSGGESAQWGTLTAFRTSKNMIVEAREYWDSAIADPALGL